MASLFGRKVVGYKLNNSGGGVIAGDVLVPDASADNAFTTTNSAAVTTGAWVADETIASGATGRVVLEGHVTLINVTASVTRGHLGTTSTTVKKAVSTGGTTRTVGTFCRFTTGGTTPEADLWPVDLGAGSGMTNPMTGVGAIIQGTTAGAPVELAAPLAGKVLTGAGVTTPLVYSYPPGYEFDYVQATANVTLAGTTDAGATTIVTGNAVAYDGSTVIMVEVYFPSVAALGSGSSTLVLYDGSSSLCQLALVTDDGGGTARSPVYASRRLTPSNASHTYSVRGFSGAGTGVALMGDGASTHFVPGYIRQTKV